MSTPVPAPAEQYARFRERQADPEFTAFRGLYDFEFDPFQVAACGALTEGDGVLVAAPTGSGKTVVGEYAVHLALAQGRKCFYTTPIKALSNQKYSDLVRRYDTDTVGLTASSAGSRVTFASGAAAVEAARDVLRQMKEHAARLLEVEPGTVNYASGVFTTSADTGKRLTFREVAARVSAMPGRAGGAGRPAGPVGPIRGSANLMPPGPGSVPPESE